MKYLGLGIGAIVLSVVAHAAGEEDGANIKPLQSEVGDGLETGVFRGDEIRSERHGIVVRRAPKIPPFEVGPEIPLEERILGRCKLRSKDENGEKVLFDEEVSHGRRNPLPARILTVEGYKLTVAPGMTLTENSPSVSVHLKTGSGVKIFSQNWTMALGSTLDLAVPEDNSEQRTFYLRCTTRAAGK